MKLTLAIVMDLLNEYGAISLISEDCSFQFEHIRIITSQTKDYRSDILYIGKLSQLKSLHSADLKNICVVCIGKSENIDKFLQKHTANLIALPEKTDLHILTNRLYTAFDWLSDWSRHLEQALLTNASYQELVELGKLIFDKNPIILVNSSYNILGASVDSVPDNDKINELLSLGYYPKDTTDGLASMGYQAKGPKLAVPTAIFPPTYMNCPLYILAFHSKNGIFLGFITIYFTENTPSDGMFDLFVYYANQIRNYYFAQSVHKDILTPTPLERFMTDLIEHTFDDESYLIDRARVLQLPLDASYRLGIIQWEDFSLSQANYVIGRLRSSLNFPFFKVILYRQSVLMLLRGEISSLKLIEEVTQFYDDFTTLLKICHGYAGFSTICDSLFKLDVAYKQACSAAKYGIHLAPEEGIYFYSRFYIYDMLDCYTNQFALEDMYVQKLKKLKKPEDGDYSNLDLLRNYLLTERSISTTAKLMHMHRNSVIYRLSKIQEQLGVDLDNPDVRLRMLISFKILELLSGRLKPLPERETIEQEYGSDLTSHE